MIAPAFYRDFGPQSPVTALPAAMICANLDRLEVYVGGEHVATLRPDRAGYPHLAYPPSFADFGAVDGSVFPELRIDGYLGDDQVASRCFSFDPSGDVLALAADDTEIDADGADATRLEFRAADRYGAPRPYVQALQGRDYAQPILADFPGSWVEPMLPGLMALGLTESQATGRDPAGHRGDPRVAARRARHRRRGRRRRGPRGLPGRADGAAGSAGSAGRDLR